jgi:hypothetical protein
MTAAQGNDGVADDFSGRVRTEMQRAIQRNLKGLEFLSAAPQAVGAMEKELLYRRGTALLYKFKPVRDEVYRAPLLIVTPPSNHGYIFDLAKGQSMVEFLLRRGFDIYLLDWVAPTREEAKLGLADYAEGFIPEAIGEVLAASGEEVVGVAVAIAVEQRTDGPAIQFVRARPAEGDRRERGIVKELIVPFLAAEHHAGDSAGIEVLLAGVHRVASHIELTHRDSQARIVVD